MNKIYFCVLPLALLLAAYSGQSVAQEAKAEMAADKHSECKGEPQAPMVNLNIKAKRASPECIRVHLGSTIVFRITPKKNLQLGMVRIEPVNPLDVWLRATNDEIVDVIIIRVPGEHDPDRQDHPHSDHDYTIEVSDEYIDPRVQVEF
jgi:hypothetical protein